ncbi:hypothetical protein FOM02_41560 [Bradyrhizobium sp. SEMIA]|nr:hypothetical protein FOM02_41560 [Bradyrhizobium sp. SEMIA]
MVLTPGVCASSLAIARKATGAIVHRSPGRARLLCSCFVLIDWRLS